MEWISTVFGTSLSEVKNVWKSNQSARIAVYLSSALAIFGVTYALKKRSEKKKQNRDWNEESHKRIILHQYPRTTVMSQCSPACLKLECFLSLYGIPYRNVFSGAQHPRTSKCPWITYKGKDYYDSELVLEMLRSDESLEIKDLDSKLSAVEQSIAHAYRIMCEEHLYWICLYQRWVDNSDDYPSRILGQIVPSLILPIIIKVVRKQAYAQGIGRFSRAEVYEFGRKNVQSILTYLGDKPFFFGDTITSIDVVMFAHLIQLYELPYEFPCDGGLPNPKSMKEYLNRVKKEIPFLRNVSDYAALEKESRKDLFL